MFTDFWENICTTFIATLIEYAETSFADYIMLYCAMKLCIVYNHYIKNLTSKSEDDVNNLNWIKRKLNTSLAAPGALAHRLQRYTACKIQNGRQLAPKWQTGSVNVRTPGFLGILREAFELKNVTKSGKSPQGLGGVSKKHQKVQNSKFGLFSFFPKCKYRL